MGAPLSLNVVQGADTVRYDGANRAGKTRARPFASQTNLAYIND